MAASRSDGRRRRRRLAGLAAAGFALLSPAALSAQNLGPPIPLFPEAPRAPGGAITGEPLAPPAAGWSGDTTPPGKPLPADFWHGTPRALADILLSRLPTTPSPALQTLERRVLLSQGTAPEGADAQGLDLPMLRAKALLRLGEVEAARTVIEALPEKERGATWPLYVEVVAIAGKLDRACQTVRDRIHLDQGVFWQRALIGCQGLQGKLGQASLGLQILAEEKAPRDDGLAIAVNALAGRPAPEAIDHIAQPDPLALRLLVAAHRQLSSNLIRGLRPELALAVALDQKAPSGTRLAAAERAARFGALPPHRLAALYKELAESAGSQSGPAVAHARQFAAIERGPAPADRLSRALAFADQFGRVGGPGLAARLVAPQLRAIAPDPTLAGSALAAARLLIAAGHAARARRWTELVPAPERGALSLLLHLAAGPDATDAQPANPAEMAHSVLSLALFAALGEKVAPAAWVGLPPPAWTAAGRPAAPAVSWLDLSEAGHAGRVGETALAAILVAASSGTLSTDPVVLHAAVASLRRVGLDGDARRLALEAALAASL
ncbi:MAG TPA: hypothetical protein VGR91_04415 [Stellaceae bacterium]|nr:hypothetical protein [Stellaceae bacterium]